MKLGNSPKNFTKAALITAILSFAGPISETFAQDQFTTKGQKEILLQDKQKQEIREKFGKELYNQIDNLCRMSCKMMSEKIIKTPTEIDELKNDMKNIMKQQTRLFIPINNKDQLAKAISFLSEYYKNKLSTKQKVIYEQNVELINNSIY